MTACWAKPGTVQRLCKTSHASPCKIKIKMLSTPKWPQSMCALGFRGQMLSQRWQMRRRSKYSGVIYTTQRSTIALSGCCLLNSPAADLWWAVKAILLSPEFVCFCSGPGTHARQCRCRTHTHKHTDTNHRVRVMFTLESVWQANYIQHR